MTFDKEYFEDGTKSNYHGYKDDPYYETRAKMFRELFNCHRVLDIGCAKGYQVNGFLKAGIKAWGVDISEYAISQASELARPRLEIADIDKDGLPFIDDFFTFVYCSETIEHLQNVGYLASEIYRVMKKGAQTYITTPLPDSPGALGDKTHINVHDWPFWQETFTNAGFSTVKCLEVPPCIWLGIGPKSFRIKVAQTAARRKSWKHSIMFLCQK